jgi:hypothetical protein
LATGGRDGHGGAAGVGVLRDIAYSDCVTALARALVSGALTTAEILAHPTRPH